MGYSGCIIRESLNWVALEETMRRDRVATDIPNGNNATNTRTPTIKPVPYAGGQFLAKKGSDFFVQAMVFIIRMKGDIIPAIVLSSIGGNVGPTKTELDSCITRVDKHQMVPSIFHAAALRDISCCKLCSLFLHIENSVGELFIRNGPFLFIYFI